MSVAVETNIEASTSWFPILLYHRIVPTPVSPDPYHNCISTTAFSSHLRWFHAHGYTSLSLAAHTVFDPLQRRRGKHFAITFDDGYEDNYVHAWPLLREFGFTASVFVVTDTIGGMNEFDADLGVVATRMLRREQIRELHANGFEIGSHSCSHPPSLTELGEAAMRDELVRSRSVLEDLIQAPAKTFSYPRSRVDQRTEVEVKRAGYDLALAGEGFLFSRYRMHRIFAPAGEGAAIQKQIRARQLKRLLRTALPGQGAASHG